jgi:O-antigen ligase
LPFAWQDRELLGIRLGAGGSFTEIPSELGSIGERRVLVDAGNKVFQLHPLTGIGVGGTPQAFLKEFPNFPVSYQPVHFVILNSAVETGLFGAVFYLGLLAGPWAVLYTKRRMALNPDLVAAFALLLAISVVGFFDYYTWLLVPGRLWQWLAWGLWAKFSLLNE